MRRLCGGDWLLCAALALYEAVKEARGNVVKLRPALLRRFIDVEDPKAAAAVRTVLKKARQYAGGVVVSLSDAKIAAGRVLIEILTKT